MGVPVTGASCVKSTPNNTAAAALWVVGGTNTNASYPGLQRFTFADGSWENITLSSLVTKDRLYHNAVYLNVSDTILVYAGTQDGTLALSSQTFTIQASEPFTVLSHPSQAPPAISPLLMQWTDNQAIMIYGSRAMVFDPDPSLLWFDSGANLTNPIYNTTIIQSLLMLGADSSKSLYTFDMSVAPNQVNRTVLVGSNGLPISNAQPIVSRGLDISGWEGRMKQVRDEPLTLANWPSYNGTLASSSIRTTYSIAEDETGLTVISGGNDQDILCMFQAVDNTWLNATAALVSPNESQAPLLAPTSGIASTASVTASSTPSSTASSSSTAASNAATTPSFPVKILLIVLGSILGVALIFLIALLLLKARRKRQQHTDAGHQRRASGMPSNEKEVMENSSRGLAGLTSTRPYRGHQTQGSQASYNSVAILMGRVGGHKKGGSADGSDSSSQFNKKYRAEISNPIPQRLPYRNFQQPVGNGKTASTVEERGGAPRARASRGGRGGSTRRSSGWDRYWSGGSAMNLLGFGSKRTTYEDSAGDSESFYSEQRHPSQVPSQVTQPSAIVPPLKLAGQPELNQVSSGSPKIAHTSSKFPLTREMSGQIERPESMNSLSSYGDDRHDAFSSGVPASVHEVSSWTPVEGLGWGGNFSKEARFPTPPSQRRPAQHSSDMSWLNLGGDSRV
jgi:hypothetical protein